jgi:hypothetical protein
LVSLVVQGIIKLIHGILLLISAEFCAPFWMASHFCNFAGFEPISSALLVMLIVWVVLSVKDYAHR